MAWSIFTDGGGDSVAVGWAKQLLQMIGAPVTPENTEFVYQWEKSEGGGGKFNPLNQGVVYGHPELTTTGEQYGGGAADYASWQAGLTGATDYLNTPGPDNYPAIRDALRANNPQAARQALFQSGWAASHYGYGSNWASVPLPGNASTITPLDPGSAGGTNAVPVSNPCSSVGLPGSAMRKACEKVYGMVPASPSTGSDACIWSLFGQCFFSKTNVRAMAGAALLGAGGVVTLVGTVVVMRYGLERTNAVQNLSRIPGMSPVARRLS
jgi:hypothetical protein